MAMFLMSCILYLYVIVCKITVFQRKAGILCRVFIFFGLYLAREIVTRQGGYIKVVSEPGKGSEFSIMLPLR